MNCFRAAFTLLILVSAASAAADDPPKPFSGKVVSITDGDTIVVLLGTTQHKIRLLGIDAPESKQAFGTKSKQALGDLVAGKDVTVKWKERDRYKRILGDVYLGDRSISREMVAEGLAWHFVRYSSDPALAKAEAEAKAAKRGLWADANPVAPWDYRKKAKKKT